MSFLMTEEIKEKWQPIVEAEGVAPIKNATTRNALIQVLENTVAEAATGAAPANTTTSLDGTQANYATNANLNPILISLIRRAMPSLIANDILGVQPMSAPTGLIFVMKSFKTIAGTTSEVLIPGTAAVDAGTATTADGEKLGTKSGVDTSDTGAAGDPVTQTDPWDEMSFTIEKTAVEAKTRAMKATYTQELAQDLKAQHGLEAETELANLITVEIVAEMNREIITKVKGTTTTEADTVIASSALAVAGEYDVNLADGRWAAEKFRMLAGYITLVANRIFFKTGRGAGNFIITSATVANALAISGSMTAVASGVAMSGDTSGSGATMVGTINNGSIKVYVDQYQSDDTVTVGYKGTSVYDAGHFYCPYIPLTMMKATGPDDFQPRIGFKSRYGLVSNPFGASLYYRDFEVKNLLGAM